MGYGGVGLWRGIGMVFIGVVMHKVNNLNYSFSDPTEFRKLFVRNILCGAQSFAIALSLLYIPTSSVHTVINCGPMIIYVVDYFQNGTLINRKQFVGIVISFLGIILTVNMNLLSEYFGLEISMNLNSIILSHHTLYNT